MKIKTAVRMLQDIQKKLGNVDLHVLDKLDEDDEGDLYPVKRIGYSAVKKDKAVIFF